MKTISIASAVLMSMSIAACAVQPADTGADETEKTSAGSSAMSGTPEGLTPRPPVIIQPPALTVGAVIEGGPLLCVYGKDYEPNSGINFTVSNIPGRTAPYTRHLTVGSNGSIGYALNNYDEATYCTQAEAFGSVTVTVNGWGENQLFQSIPSTITESVPASLWCGNYENGGQWGIGCPGPTDP